MPRGCYGSVRTASTTFTARLALACCSLCVIGYQISYAIPLVLRVTTGRSEFKQAVFNLGRWSIPIHTVSAAWLIITSTFFFWPMGSWRGAVRQAAAGSL
jgi:hypothetical protein